jgi:hypothetical protein
MMNWENMNLQRFWEDKKWIKTMHRLEGIDVSRQNDKCEWCESCLDVMSLFPRH